LCDCLFRSILYLCEYVLQQSVVSGVSWEECSETSACQKPGDVTEALQSQGVEGPCNWWGEGGEWLVLGMENLANISKPQSPPNEQKDQ